MPRQARLEAPGMVHHVILRGIKRGQIVAGREDRKSFLGRLGLSLADTVRQLGVSTSGIAKSGRRSGATISPLSQRRPVLRNRPTRSSREAPPCKKPTG